MKLLKFEKIKHFTVIGILFIIYFYLSAANYASAVSKDLSDSVLRLHVLANSNSTEDQALKYKVRDNIIQYMNSIIGNTNSKEAAIKLVMDNKETFIEIANNTIHESGFDYPVNIEFGNFHFPTKTYGDISFPAGNYDAIRIEIGDAKGKNWWCVMFPPLCFVDVSSGIVPDESKDQIKSTINDEEFSLISNNSQNTDSSAMVQFKFKLIELLNNSHFLTANKDK